MQRAVVEQTSSQQPIAIARSFSPQPRERTPEKEITLAMEARRATSLTRRESQPRSPSPVRPTQKKQCKDSDEGIAVRSAWRPAPWTERRPEASSGGHLTPRAKSQIRGKAVDLSVRRWGSERTNSSTSAGSTPRSIGTRGYLNRMNQRTARISSNPPCEQKRISPRDTTEQAQSCHEAAPRHAKGAEARKHGSELPTAPSLNVPQIGRPVSEEPVDRYARLQCLQARLKSRSGDGTPRNPRSWLKDMKDMQDMRDLNVPKEKETPKEGPKRPQEGPTEEPSERKEAKAASGDVTSRLHHAEPVVRQAAVAALGALGRAAKDDARLLAASLRDTDAGVRRAAAIALGNLGKPASAYTDALLAASRHDNDDDVRFHAAVALGMLGASKIDLEGCRCSPAAPMLASCTLSFPA
ncbi:unnamed protein product [Effrenium voratum]|nr:unnamed protein product [Effrenium voratum]